MFARVLTVKMRPGMRYAGEKLAQRWHAGVATLPGFVSVTFFGDDAAGEYGYFSLWKTRADAEAVAEMLGEQPGEALQELAAEPPVVRIYGVFEPPA